MSNQTDRPYTPTPVPMADETRAALVRAAGRSTSLRVLLDHVAWLEQERDGVAHLIYELAIDLGPSSLRNHLALYHIATDEAARIMREREKRGDLRIPPILHADAVATGWRVGESTADIVHWQRLRPACCDQYMREIASGVDHDAEDTYMHYECRTCGKQRRVYDHPEEK